MWRLQVFRDQYNVAFIHPKTDKNRKEVRIIADDKTIVILAKKI